MPKMNGKKLPYPDAEKRMGGGKIMYRGGGSLSYGKMKMGGGGVAEDVSAAGIDLGAAAGAAGAQASSEKMLMMRRKNAAGRKNREGSTRGPNPSELDGREKEEQEEYLRRLEEAYKAATTGAVEAATEGAAAAVKPKEKKGMGGSIARGSGAARAQQFRRNG